MWENRQKRIGKFSVILLSSMLWSVGVGLGLANAQIKENEPLNSSNRILALTVEVLDVSANVDKNLPIISKNQQGDICLKTQVATQLVRLESHGQTENHPHKALEGDNQKIIDFELQSDINSQWSEMMRSLKEGDEEELLRFISTNQREAARKELPMLKKYLGNLTENFSEPLHLTAIEGNQIVAQATMPATQASLQCPLEFNFVLDSDGQWRLRYD